MQKDFNEPLDFMNDPDFISWVFKTNSERAAKWDRWIADNPGKAAMAEEAAGMMRLVQFKETVVPAQQIDNAEARLFETIRLEKTKPVAKLVSIKFRKIWYAAAAIILIGVLAISIRLITNTPARPQFATSYGQIRHDKLPDGTEVTLNANSKLTYPKQWVEGTDREVWINGEAFFHVKKTSHRNRFIVHTDAFDIEVTGTSFNVINREGMSTVILKEGSVKIHRPGENEITMVPGDYVGFVNQQLQKKIISKPNYLAWTENKLVFDNTPMSEVADIIRQHYGVKVNLQGDHVKDKTVSGLMPNNNLDVLLKTLEAALDVKIAHVKDEITITDTTN
ncbi:MAG: FecR domain-containing protein [Ferruginibacter sp.]